MSCGQPSLNGAGPFCHYHAAVAAGWCEPTFPELKPPNWQPWRPMTAQERHEERLRRWRNRRKRWAEIEVDNEEPRSWDEDSWRLLGVLLDRQEGGEGPWM